MLPRIKWLLVVFPGVKRPRVGVDHPPIFRAEVEKCKVRGKFSSRTGLVCPAGGVEVQT